MALRCLMKLILIGLLINLVILFINFYNLKTFENQFNQIKPFKNNSNCNIEVWSKASIGDYFWEHILKATIEKNLENGYYRFGKKVDQNLTFRFRSGYSIVPTKLQEFLDEKFSKKDAKINLILILNGRTKENAQIAESYLNLLYQYKNKLNLGVILLGNENCFNNWIKNHLNNGLIKILFVVYDWNQIDNVNIFQWPLGVATYRNFKLIKIDKNLVTNKRKYLCNYVATTYRNSSREELKNLLGKSRFKDHCLVNVRQDWAPNETKESSFNYHDALRNSDMTLSPLGINHECYRIYEAFSYLSVPILEENLNHVKDRKSNCDKKTSYRLLKEYKAPIKFVSNWTENLNQVLLDELNLTNEDRLFRRIKLFNWYENFKESMKLRFISLIKKKFSC